MKPILTVLLLILSSTVFGQKWEVIYESATQTIYYNSERTTKIGNIITTWTKSVYKGEMLEKVRKLHKDAVKGSSYSSNYDNFNYVVQKVQIDCSDYKTITLTLVDYNEDGSIINNVQMDNPNWTESLPGTVGEQSCMNVCSAVK